MGQQMNWEEIERLYNQQWVELIDFDWPDGKPFPRSGVVRVHAADRKEFYKLAKINPPVNSAILFVGKPEVPEGTVLCSSIMHIRDAHH